MRGLLLVLLLGASGCGGCRGSDRPTDAVVQAEVKKRLDEVPELVAKICGVDVKKLVDPTVSVVSSSGDTFKVRISGRPDLPDAGDDDDDDDDDDAGPEAGPRNDGGAPEAGARVIGARGDGGVVTSKGKALVCAGLFTIEVKRVLDNDGKMKAWGSGALALESVETGKTSEPKPHTRRRRRRHHH